jgi:hypothetical protein
MNTTIHIITASPDPAWRAHLISTLEALHPGAAIKVGSGSFDDVFVWTTEMGVGSDLAMTLDALEEEKEERLSCPRLSRGSFDSAVCAAEDLAEQVESEIAKIKRAWRRRGAPRKVSAGLLSVVAGLFR